MWRPDGGDELAKGQIRIEHEVDSMNGRTLFIHKIRHAHRTSQTYTIWLLFLCFFSFDIVIFCEELHI